MTLRFPHVLLGVALVCWSSVPLTNAAFTFSFSSPTECDDLTLTWSGGESPFSLLLIPVFGTPRNITIPDSAFSNGAGLFKTQLNFAAKEQLLLAMSDSQGFGTGGTTDVLTVGSSVGGSSCNTTDPGVDFTFELNDALQQCRTFSFSNYNSATQPVHILGIVPGGGHIELNPPTGPTSFDWTVDVAGGQSMVFLMYDSKGRQGGSSDVRLVSVSSDSRCLDNSAPSSTANPPAASTSSSTSATDPASSSTTSTAPSASETGHTSSAGVGPIVGTVIGAVIAIAAVITLGMFFIRRRRSNRAWNHPRRNASVDLLGKPGGPSGPVSHVYAYPHPTTAPYASQTLTSHESLAVTPSRSQHDIPTGSTPFLTSHNQYEPDPFVLPPLASPTVSSLTERDTRSRPTSTIQSQTSSARRKASLAGVHSYNQPARFILHTDLEEVEPDENGVVELPPQYTPHRAPIPAERIASVQPHLPGVPEGQASNQTPPTLPSHRAISPFSDEAAVRHDLESL
ncbi:hypothetical protein PUNSTDRAFT_140507 [Punctularia strigosozonata HHB-11173 SS5]|uniref:uncharacterized protein n=1 Tax=Punctularia strigosozonata (strain HHB-11173) TaxID=741275 RepID=UPI0004417248|nr:uncharacterized protein PUNSTDRAFT_140507 [Punctularia strigosozonata HHB-11173 SS5]EIN14150.1 hypothetical protein PUNSTDRAFT_140507 [Punctularia strigosozonata HHB-11173 SS5]